MHINANKRNPNKAPFICIFFVKTLLFLIFLCYDRRENKGAISTKAKRIGGNA